MTISPKCLMKRVGKISYVDLYCIPTAVVSGPGQNDLLTILFCSVFLQSRKSRF
jgi:hypothetical protein